jgi:predicted AAA+ superfamily ATPase
MNQKMYIVDLDIRRHLLPRKRYDLGFSLENLVYLELLHRGYEVNIGKVGAAEIDFFARKSNNVYTSRSPHPWWRKLALNGRWPR